MDSQSTEERAEKVIIALTPEQLKDICANAAEIGAKEALKTYLEINILGISEKKHYPTEKFWRIPAEIGNKVILGLDAHCAKQLANVECYKKAVELADKYNLNLIDELPGM